MYYKILLFITISISLLSCNKDKTPLRNCSEIHYNNNFYPLLDDQYQIYSQFDTVELIGCYGGNKRGLYDFEWQIYKDDQLIDFKLGLINEQYVFKESGDYHIDLLSYDDNKLIGSSRIDYIILDSIKGLKLIYNKITNQSVETPIRISLEMSNPKYENKVYKSLTVNSNSNKTVLNCDKSFYLLEDFDCRIRVRDGDYNTLYDTSFYVTSSFPNCTTIDIK